MAKGFVDWRPDKNTQAVLPDVLDIIEAGRADWPLSQRYWLYRLVALKGWEKVDEYNKAHYPKADRLERPHYNLNRILDMGRRSGQIPWGAVVSKRGEIKEVFTRDNAEGMADTVEHLVRSVQFGRQEEQERSIAIWCETEGLVPLLEKVAKHYGAVLLAGQGFDTIGKKHDFAERIAALGDVLILHMGDLDRSGHTVHVSLMEDLHAYLDELGGNMELKRIGLLESQLAEFNVAKKSLKLTPEGLNKGNHGKGFTSKYECQLEALSSENIKAIAAAAFEAELDMELFNERLELEKEERLRTLDVLRERLSD